MSRAPNFNYSAMEGLDKVDLDRFEIIICDFFDTVCTRIVAPEDVKRLAAARLSEAMCCESGHLLYQSRAQLERELCDQAVVKGLDAEFRLKDLASCLYWKYQSLQTKTESDFVEYFVKLECAVELSVLRRDEVVVGFLERAKAAGKTIFLLSDYYMQEDQFQEVLEGMRLKQLFNKLNMSADTFNSKRSGRAYDHLLQINKLNPSRVFMIGDNEHSDVNMSRSRGIEAFHLQRTPLHSLYAQMSRSFNNETVLRAELDEILSNSTGDGVFPEFALTLYVFIRKLSNQLTADGVRRVCFLSREGQFLKTLYDLYAEKTKSTKLALPASRYMLVSRRSTFICGLGSIENERFDILFRQYVDMSLNEFLRNLGVSDDDFVASLAQDKTSERISNLPESERFKTLMSNSAFQSVYEKHRINQRAAFGAYISELFEERSRLDQIALVDVGWKGSIQDNIFRFLSTTPDYSETKVRGYYIGLVAPGAMAENNEKLGLLFSSLNGFSPGFWCFNENRAIFEILLGADHGSTRRYEILSTGAPNVVLDSFDEEKHLFETHIAPQQWLLLRAFERITELFVRHGVHVDWVFTELVARHRRMVFEPTVKELDWIRNVFHVENFGVFEKSVFTSPAASNFFHRLEFTWRLYRNRPLRPNLLGFWPTLSLAQHALPGVRWFYRKRRYEMIARSIR